MLWKSYIDFEIEQEEYENTRNLYRRLLQRTQHVKVRTPPKLNSILAVVALIVHTFATEINTEKVAPDFNVANFK